MIIFTLIVLEAIITRGGVAATSKEVCLVLGDIPTNRRLSRNIVVPHYRELLRILCYWFLSRATRKALCQILQE